MSIRFAASICAVALLAVTPAAGQEAPEASAPDTDPDDQLSAARADAAYSRFDTSVGYVDQSGPDQATLEMQFTRVFGGNHQVTAVLPLIDPDVDSSATLRGGDIKLGYSYTPAHALTANPWVPSDIGTGIGLSIPTGDVSDGTGTGSYIVAPRVGFVKTIGKGFAVSPNIQYLYSFDEGDDGIEFREWGFAAQLIYVGPRTIWVNWTPEYLYDTNVDDGDFGHTFIVGKLFTRHFALSFEYSRVPTFVPTASGSETEFTQSYLVNFHVPFGYQH
jgi:hypothetical protein